MEQWANSNVKCAAGGPCHVLREHQAITRRRAHINLFSLGGSVEASDITAGLEPAEFRLH